MKSLQLICIIISMGSALSTPIPLDSLHTENAKNNNQFLSQINDIITKDINRFYAKQLIKRDANSTEKETKDNVEILVQKFTSNFPFPLSFNVPKDDTLDDIDVVKDFSNKTVTEYKLTQEHEDDKKSDSSTVLPTTLHNSLTSLRSSSPSTAAGSTQVSETTISTTPKVSSTVFMDGFDNSTSHPLNSTSNTETHIKFVETSTIPSSTLSVPLTTEQAKNSTHATEKSTVSTSATTSIPKSLSSTTLSSSTVKISPIINETTTQSSINSTTMSSPATSDEKIISVSVNSTVSNSDGNSSVLTTTISAPTHLPDKTNAPTSTALPKTSDESFTGGSTEKLTTTTTKIIIDSTTRAARLLETSTTSTVNSISTTEVNEKGSQSSSTSESSVSSTSESSIIDKVQSLISRKIAEIHG